MTRRMKKYNYYGSNYPLNLNRYSEQGDITARNKTDAKRKIKRRFKNVVVW